MLVKNANLPHYAKCVLIGDKYAGKLSNSLNKLNLMPIIVPNNPLVDARLNGHADLSVIHTGGERVYLAPFLRNSDFSKQIGDLGAEVLFADISQGADYPFDAQLNMCIVGKFVFCNPKVHCSTIVEFLTSKKHLTPIVSRQGYSRCSICPVDANSIITADGSIAVAAELAGFNVLKISDGSIRLDGFDYGFIGGASFKIADKIMAFTGVLDRLPEKDEILRFLAKRNIKTVFLTDEPILDVGGIIPVTERYPAGEIY